MMDSDDDDIYPTNDTITDRQAIKTEPDADEEGEEGEDDSDEEINFITDAKEVPKPEPQSQPKRPSTTDRKTSEQPRRSASPRRRRRSSQSQSHSQTADNHIKSERVPSPTDSKPGTDYPARHTSKLDVNGNPVHPLTGKPILSTDLDADFSAESSKPWRKPGADITDYFNYGFDEFTFASYCLKQQQMPKQVKEINQEAEQMKAFVEGIPGGGMPGMPGVPTGPGGGGGGVVAAGAGGMPSDAEMQQMFGQMMAQGIDPSQMDQNQFMQMMMGGGGQPPQGPGAGGYGGGFDQGPGFGGGGGGGGGGRRGGRRGRGNW